MALGACVMLNPPPYRVRRDAGPAFSRAGLKFGKQLGGDFQVLADVTGHPVQHVAVGPGGCHIGLA